MFLEDSLVRVEGKVSQKRLRFSRTANFSATLPARRVGSDAIKFAGSLASGLYLSNPKIEKVEKKFPLVLANRFLALLVTLIISIQSIPKAAVFRPIGFIILFRKY